MFVYYGCMTTYVNTEMTQNTKKIGRPTVNPQDKQFQMRVDEEFLRLIDDWRGQKRPIPNRADAVRHLVKAGVAAERKR